MPYSCGSYYHSSEDDEDWDEDEDDDGDWDDEDEENLNNDDTIYQPQPKVEEKKMTKYIPHIISGDSITVFSNGVSIFPSTHLFYRDICNAVKAGDEAKLAQLVACKDRQGLEVLDDEVLWNGEPLHSTAARRLFEIKAAGFDTTPIKNFLKNCQENPFPQVVEKLYDFLESRGMPLTEDGCFLGYKYCNENYYDSHTGKTYKFFPYTHVVATNIENKGKICDLNGEECSGQGIHVGNFEYSGHHANVVYVKVNPKDVLSVPVGVNAKKIRVWELDVLGRTDGQQHQAVVVTNDGKSIDYVKGNTLECLYKNGDGKIEHLDGYILNVGDVYLELDEGWERYENDDYDSEWGGFKRRLKIANIVEVL